MNCNWGVRPYVLTFRCPTTGVTYVCLGVSNTGSYRGAAKSKKPWDLPCTKLILRKFQKIREQLF